MAACMVNNRHQPLSSDGPAAHIRRSTLGNSTPANVEKNSTEASSRPDGHVKIWEWKSERHKGEKDFMQRDLVEALKRGDAAAMAYIRGKVAFLVVQPERSEAREKIEQSIMKAAGSGVRHAAALWAMDLRKTREEHPIPSTSASHPAWTLVTSAPHPPQTPRAARSSLHSAVSSGTMLAPRRARICARPSPGKVSTTLSSHGSHGRLLPLEWAISPHRRTSCHHHTPRCWLRWRVFSVGS